MNRRGILGLLGGAAIAGPKAASDILAKVGGSTGAAIPTPLSGPAPWGHGTVQGGIGSNHLSAEEMLRHEAHRAFYNMRQEWRRDAEIGPNGYGLSHKIRTKKSWSEAFKASVHVKEMREWDEIERRIRDEHGFAEMFLRMLGVPP